MRSKYTCSANIQGINKTLIGYPTNSFVFTQPTRWVGWVGVQFAYNIERERERALPELSMTKPVLLPLIASFEPSPLRYIILQSVNLSLRRKSVH